MRKIEITPEIYEFPTEGMTPKLPAQGKKRSTIRGESPGRVVKWKI
jgi:hypothetical protein